MNSYLIFDIVVEQKGRHDSSEAEVLHDNIRLTFHDTLKVEIISVLGQTKEGGDLAVQVLVEGFGESLD